MSVFTLSDTKIQHSFVDSKTNSTLTERISEQCHLFLIFQRGEGRLGLHSWLGII